MTCLKIRKKSYIEYPINSKKHINVKKGNSKESCSLFHTSRYALSYSLVICGRLLGTLAYVAIQLSLNFLDTLWITFLFAFTVASIMSAQSASETTRKQPPAVGCQRETKEWVRCGPREKACMSADSSLWLGHYIFWKCLNITMFKKIRYKVETCGSRDDIA